MNACFRSLALVAVGALAVCSDKGDDGDDTGSGSAGPFRPQEGLWDQVGDQRVISDDCGFWTSDSGDSGWGDSGWGDSGWGDSGETGDGGEDGLLLTMTSDTTFTWSESESSEDDTGEVLGPFECTLDGHDFECEPQQLGWSLLDMGYDAVLNYTFSLSGTFATSASATVRLDLTLDCEGADCEELRGDESGGTTLPCESVSEVDIATGGSSRRRATGRSWLPFLSDSEPTAVEPDQSAVCPTAPEIAECPA